MLIFCEPMHVSEKLKGSKKPPKVFERFLKGSRFPRGFPEVFGRFFSYMFDITNKATLSTLVNASAQYQDGCRASS